MGTPLASAAWTAGITIVVLFAALVAAGFWIIARRKKNGPAPDTVGDLQKRANILLVRVDDAVKNAEDELGYALAQFGRDKTGDFRTALDEARTGLREAFALQQKLDDAYPDTATQRREWTARIIHLCEKARRNLGEQEEQFAELRQLEKNAPGNLAAVRALIESMDERDAKASETLAELRKNYTDTAIASVADNLARAHEERGQAIAATETAQARLEKAEAGATAADAIRTAEEHAYRALSLLDAIGTAKTELATAADAVTALQDATRRNLDEARALRDAPPDADSSAAVARAIETVESALAAKDAHSDPLASLEVLRAANAELDMSLAGARNQQRRLEGARTALVGALVGARSQLATTRDYISTRRGDVGAEARTRLAEAERLLQVAEAESDPVAALDAARSSATYSRDADALARYDLLKR